MALIARGLPDGPFTGVPFLLKGTGAAMAGVPLTNGSALLRGVVSAADSTLAARFKAAGLVPLGRTKVPEFALSFTTEPAEAGPARNPWDLGRSPGGSSGGSAAAVAAGIVPMAHAADGAGSIRVPAAHCGLFGFKPSRMRTPSGPEVGEGIAGMGTPHALTRSVRDSAALLDAVGGADAGDPYAAVTAAVTGAEKGAVTGAETGAKTGAERFGAAIGRPPRPLRIGLVTTHPLGAPIDPACLAATEAAAALCARLGHAVEPAAWEHEAEGLRRAWRVIAGVNLVRPAELHGRRLGLADPADAMEAVNAAWLREGAATSGATYLDAVNQLHRIGRQMAAFFGRYDVMLSPSTAMPAPKLGHFEAGELDGFYDRFWSHAPFAPAYNASGCPAMSVPLGWTEDGLPVGVQFGAGAGQDALLFALAAQLEQAQPWFDRRPPEIH